MKLDPEARYAENHEWARQDGDEFVCGISDYAQERLSDVVYVELPDEGDVFERGDIFGTVESVKSANDMYVPMGGEIVAVNRDLEDTPAPLSRRLKSWQKARSKPLYFTRLRRREPPVR